MMLFLAVVMLAPPQGQAPADLQGRWRVSEEIVQGVTSPEAGLHDLRIEIDATSLRLIDGEQTLDCTLAVDAQLRTLAVTPGRGPQADRRYHGLWTRTGDRLTLCLRIEPSATMPEAMLMTGAAGSKQMLITLTRER